MNAWAWPQYFIAFGYAVRLLNSLISSHDDATAQRAAIRRVVSVVFCAFGVFALHEGGFW